MGNKFFEKSSDKINGGGHRHHHHRRMVRAAKPVQAGRPGLSA